MNRAPFLSPIRITQEMNTSAHRSALQNDRKQDGPGYEFCWQTNPLDCGDSKSQRSLVVESKKPRGQKSSDQTLVSSRAGEEHAEETNRDVGAVPAHVRTDRVEDADEHEAAIRIAGFRPRPCAWQ